MYDLDSCPISSLFSSYAPLSVFTPFIDILLFLWCFSTGWVDKGRGSFHKTSAFCIDSCPWVVNYGFSGKGLCFSSCCCFTSRRELRIKVVCLWKHLSASVAEIPLGPIASKDTSSSALRQLYCYCVHFMFGWLQSPSIVGLGNFSSTTSSHVYLKLTSIYCWKFERISHFFLYKPF